MGMISQSLDDFKSAKSFEPKKVQEYKKKAKKALQRKHYNKAYKYLHKAKTYREQPLMIVDEFWMMNGIYTDAKGRESIVLDTYMNSNKNSNNLQIGNLGAGTEFHLKLQNYFKVAALNYLYMLPSTMQLCEAMNENKILEILNSSTKNKYLESIKTYKEPLKYIKLGLTEMHVEYREIEDVNNPCVDKIIKFIENGLIPSVNEIK